MLEEHEMLKSWNIRKRVVIRGFYLQSGSNL